MAGSDAAARLSLAERMWGWRAHPTQREWMLDEHDVKAAACGRRWGKTEAQAVDAATFALLFPGSRQIVVAPTYDQAKLIAGGMERLLLGHPATRRHTQVRKTPYPQIRILRSEISARSADDDGRSLRGHRADRVMVDEAAFVRDSVIAEVVQPMLADTAGQIILISTPCGRNHFWRTWQAGQREDPRVKSFRFPSASNPHISSAYVEGQRREIPERSFRAEYLAEFIDDAACVFPWADLESCRLLARETPAVSDGRIVAGIDWARYSDYTVCLSLDASRRPWRVTAIDRFQGLGWDAAVERAAAFLERSGAITALCDATSVGDPVLEGLRRRLERSRSGVAAEGLVFTASSKRDIVDHLALAIGQRALALPVDGVVHADVLLEEMRSYEYELRASGAPAYSAPPGRHDDCVMALALAAWQAREMPEFRIYASSSLPHAASCRAELETEEDSRCLRKY